MVTKKEVAVKIKVRDAFMANLKNVLENTKQIYAAVEEGEDSLKDELTTKFELLNDRMKKITTLNEEILGYLDDTEEIEREVTVSTDFELEMRKEFLKIKRILKNDIDSRSEISVTTNASTHTGVKLPKLTIKRFSGDPLEWKTFVDSFNCSIHTSDLPEVQKMTHLINLLEGQALDAVKGLSLTERNYQTALEILEERFGDKQYLISAHMNKLLTLEKIKHENDLLAMRNLCDLLKAQVRSLNNLGINAKDYGPLLIPVIITKIPKQINVIICRKFEEDKRAWDINEILKLLETELSVREKLGQVNEREKADKASNGERFSGAALNSSSNFKQGCLFCSGPHKAQDCKKFDLKKRKEFLMKEGRCFRCLKKGHLSRNCPSNIKCFECKGRHHLAVCEEIHSKEKNTESNVSLVIDRNQILLQTARARVSSVDDKNFANLRILFDSGSQLSYISPRARKILKLKTEKTRSVNLKTFGENATENTLDEVKLCVKDSKNNESIYVNAFVNKICQPLTGQHINFAVKEHEHLQNLKLADSNDNESLFIDILIGQDHYWQFFKDKIIRSENKTGPVAMETKLGYVLSGPISQTNESATCSSTLSVHNLQILNEISEERISDIWNLESIGISPNELKQENSFNEEIEFVNKRYQVKLPFKSNHEELPDNLKHAKFRLKGQWERYKRNPALLIECDKTLKEQLSLNIIEEVPPNESSNVNVHYLPHRPIVKEERETTKVRIVFDASAKGDGTFSLNDCLQTGPSLTPSLFGVLQRFRTYNVAFTSDIEKAFHQISINPEHRNYLRFLWFKNPENINFENFYANELKIYRICRVIIGATSSPAQLTSTLIHHFEKYRDSYPELIDKLLCSIHVDDFISGGSNDQDAVNTYNDAKELLSEGSFHLRKFKSNSKRAELSVNSIETPKETKVLGVVWNKESDTLQINLNEINDRLPKVPTKRSILQVLAAIYDPLGLINPTVVTLKVFFQKLCVMKCDWDTELTGELLNEWKEIENSLSTNMIFETARLFAYKDPNDPFISCQLHGFSDASSKAYGCCVYLVFKYKSGKIETILVSSKSRVNPLSNVTIPRLELLASLILVRLMNCLRTELNSVLNINDYFFWTDSSIVFSWITSTNKEFKVFVQNRISEIKANSKFGTWKLVPTKLNPADIVSRGMKFVDLCVNELWANGPMFLTLPETHWPQLKPGDCFTDETKKEEKIPNLVTEVSSNILQETSISSNLVNGSSSILLQEVSKIDDCSNLLNIITFKKYNSFNRLVRVTALVIKYVRKLRKRIKLNKRVIPEEMERNFVLSSEDLEDAQIRLLKCEQHSNVMKNEHFKQWQQTLGVFEDEKGLLRCKGRLKNAPLVFDTKYPILLVEKSELSRLIVLEAHEQVFHNGRRETLNKLRQRFWITRSRNLVKSVIKACRLCKIFEGKSYTYPNQPDLPKERLENCRAFHNIGVDYAGPVFVKNIYGDKENLHKAWIAVITCASTRAIYLDVVSDCSCQQCIELLKRFIAHYGAPQTIISDNGKCFIGKEVQTFAANRNISWKFNLELAPWQSGFIERMVRSTKRCLRKILQTSKISYHELQTILKEIESIINNRPLTYVYHDDLEYALTPNHLIYGRNLNNQADITKINTTEVNDAEQRLKYVNQLLMHFWRRWRNEYLVELREHFKREHPRKLDNINVNDVVLVADEKLPRIKWRVGRITKLFVGKDGSIRGAEVFTITDSKQTSMLRRPINKLIPLEMCESEKSDDNENNLENSKIELTFIDDKKVEFIKNV